MPTPDTSTQATANEKGFIGYALDTDPAPYAVPGRTVRASGGDDTTTMLAAINGLPAGGGAIYLPDALYQISAPLIARSGLTLQGAGMYATVIEQTGPTAQAIYGEDIVGLTVRDLRLKGPADGLSVGAIDGILLDQTGVVATQNVCLENVMVDHFSRHGVNLTDPITSALSNVRSQNNGGYGFAVTLGTSLTLRSCYANGCWTGGYSLSQTSYAELAGCACDSTGPAGIGYLIADCNGVVVSACGAEDIGTTGYRISGGTGVTINSCYSSDNDEVAFEVTDSAVKALLLNVRERSPGGTAVASVQVDAGSTATVIQASVATAASYAAGTTRVLDGGVLDVTSAGTSINGVDRGAVTNFAAYVLRTAGSDRWALQLINDSTNDVRLTDSANGGVALTVQSRATQPNLSLLTGTQSYGGGVGVVLVANATTEPTTNPTGGGILYAFGGALKFRGSGGTVTTVGPA